MKNFETSLRAFHGDALIKQKYLDRVRLHQDQDRIVRGHYQTLGDDGVYRGCAVGCTLDFKCYNNDWHQAYEDELGIPQILAELEDSIFEGLPNDRHIQWPYEFLDAIKPGADLSYVWPKFLIWLLVDSEHGVIQYVQNDAQRNAIQHVADLYQRTDFVSREEWQKASRATADAATHAAYAAADAADAATHAAYVAADGAPYAADAAAAAAAAGAAADVAAGAYAHVAAVAAVAAYADADAAGAAYAANAAGAYAYAAARVMQAEKLLELLREAV